LIFVIKETFVANGKQFEGKTALVTGAGSGIGEAIAKELAARGGKVVVADLSRDAAERVAQEIGAAGGVATAVASDVTDLASVEAMVKHAKDTFGGLDVAVNNAGIGGERSTTGDYSPEGWRQVI